MPFSLRRFITDNQLTTASRLDEAAERQRLDEASELNQLAVQLAYDLNSVLKKHNIVKTEIITSTRQGHVVFANRNKEFLIIDFTDKGAVAGNK